MTDAKEPTVQDIQSPPQEAPRPTPTTSQLLTNSVDHSDMKYRVLMEHGKQLPKK